MKRLSGMRLLTVTVLVLAANLACTQEQPTEIVISDVKPMAQGAQPAVPLPAISDRQFVVKEYGAVGDGVADDTQSIQKAIEDANMVGGGTIVLQGGVFLSGPLRMANRTCLYISEGAILKMLPYGEYSAKAGKGGSRYNALVHASSVHDVAITGPGAIEGQGQEWWEKFKSNDLAAKRPIMVLFTDCTRVLVKGIKMHNAPNVHMSVGACNDVTIEDITIATTPASPNTDGLNLRGRNILVQRCNISCGDDQIALSGPTDGVTIKDCKFLRGHGVSIGSFTRGGLANMVVDNCSFDGSEAALRGKSDRGKGGLVQNLSYSNITITGTKHPIFFSSNYDHKMKDPNEDKYVAADSLTPMWKNVTFTNINAIVPGKYSAGILWGLPEAPIENFTFRNVQIKAAKGFEIYYAGNIGFTSDCKIEAADGQPFKTYEANVKNLGGWMVERRPVYKY
jgi:polygalacturonase